KDVYHYLDGTAQQNDAVMKRGICHRIVRGLTEIWNINDKNELISTINSVIHTLVRTPQRFNF
ncbi:MAG: hypothetical protein K8R35_10845, partial [Bacteroidales bacterium]|nr:hypothetical protein [Bacteroidales bacterium]